MPKRDTPSWPKVRRYGEASLPRSAWKREQQRRNAREVAATYATGPKKTLHQARITFRAGRHE